MNYPNQFENDEVIYKKIKQDAKKNFVEKKTFYQNLPQSA